MAFQPNESDRDMWIAHKAKAKVTPKLSYEEERRDMLVREIELEMEKCQPNWVYLEALDKELGYWNSRVEANKPKVSNFWSLFGE